MKTWYRLRAARKTAELLIYEEIGAWGINNKTLLEQLTARGEDALTAASYTHPTTPNTPSR